jgi:hypothetical protein
MNFLVTYDSDSEIMWITKRTCDKNIGACRYVGEEARDLYSHLDPVGIDNPIRVTGSFSRLSRHICSDGVIPGISKITASGETIIRITNVNICDDIWYGELNSDVSEDVLKGVWGTLRFKLVKGENE